VDGAEFSTCAAQVQTIGVQLSTVPPGLLPAKYTQQRHVHLQRIQLPNPYTTHHSNAADASPTRAYLFQLLGLQFDYGLLHP
jgi:hypothetical protein